MWKDFRRDVVEQVDGKITKVGMTDGGARVSSDVSGLKNRILHRASSRQQGKLRVLDGDEAVVVGLKVKPAGATQLELLDVLMKCMGSFRGVWLRLFHAQRLKQVSLTIRHVVMSGLLGTLPRAVIIHNVAVEQGVLLGGTSEHLKRQ
jgi:hypothetical protein